MTKIWNFPTFPISAQMFHVPGGYIEGGFTRGGAMMGSPEPAGFSVLDIKPAMQVKEWDFPISSWLASKGNGEVLRVRLAPTPQVALSVRRGNSVNVPWDQELLWSNQEMWEGDFALSFINPILEGTTTAVIDCSSVGQIFQIGHVFGDQNSTHLIDEIEYDDDGYAEVLFRTPARRDIPAGAACYTRPWFLGRISNPDSVPVMYEAANNGHIQLNQITLTEAII
jgi:hypothetical protein